MPRLTGNHNNMNVINNIAEEINSSNPQYTDETIVQPGQIWREGRLRNGKPRFIRIIELKEDGALALNPVTGKTAIIKYKYFNRGKCGFHNLGAFGIFFETYILNSLIQEKQYRKRALNPSSDKTLNPVSKPETNGTITLSNFSIPIYK